jgi:hypothetical protein
MTQGARLFLGLFALIGVGTILFAVVVIRPMTGIPDGWITVPGTIVGQSVEETGRGVAYYPVVEYADEGGVPHRVVSNPGRSTQPRIGTTVEVAYDPANPDDTWVGGSSPATVWVVPALIGGLFAVLPLLILWHTSRVAGAQRTPATTDRTVTRQRDGEDVFYRSGQLAGVGGWFGTSERATLASVGPDGISVRGLERLGWADVAEIRVERIPSMQARSYRYRRLGVVPRDPRLAAGRPLGE